MRRRLFLLTLLLYSLLTQVGYLSTRVASAQVPISLVREFTLGYSGQNRPITAIQVGNGPRKLVVVGNTHGGPEANTYALLQQLVAFFQTHPDAVPSQIRLFLIPSINPDGLALGSRQDSFGVDLNRNMNTDLDTCPENDWATRIYGAGGYISDTGGPYADSQTETRLVRAFLLDASGAIFIHSNAGVVFPAFCEHAPSIRMAQVYAQDAHYLYNRYWQPYMINGGMHDWAASLGIAAITPELVSGEDSEYEQNLAGLLGVLREANTILEQPQDHTVNEISVPALIWRYWQAYGGEPIFGIPLEPVQTDTDGIQSQTFTRARLVLNPAMRDSLFTVSPALLGSERALLHSPDDPVFQPFSADERATLAQDTPFFAETGYSITPSLRDYWQRHEGMRVFGMPVSRPIERNGQVTQYFERAILVFDGETVTPQPLGWEAILRAQTNAPQLGSHAR